MTDVDSAAHGAGPHGEADNAESAPACEQRSHNFRTGAMLAAIAAGFFVAVILRHLHFG